MIPRTLAPYLKEAAAESPVVALTGPRQSGKTTLCRSVFDQHQQVTLEPLDTRDFARSDPRGFLKQHPGPVVIDEVQRAPDLFSYLQEEVDRDPSPGRFILTGSQQFGLSAGISQSLAGRVSLLNLLPMSLDELDGFDTPPADLWTAVWTGGYPRIHDRGIRPDRWLADYLATYVQRDVRQVLQVADLDAFTTLLRLAAGRSAQELNLSSLGSDAGVSHPTVRSWLSVLEASFVVFSAPPWLRNARKRVVKTPKLHFIDSGLACHLLGISTPDQLRLHPLRGAIFESWVASEILKARVHRRQSPSLFHLREPRRLEVDLIVEAQSRTIGVEVKSASTIGSDFLDGLRAFRDGGSNDDRVARLVYGGDSPQTRSDAEILPWNALHTVDWD